MKKAKALLLLSLMSAGMARATVPVPMQWWVESQPLGGSPIVKSLNTFSHNLYQQLGKTNTNSFFSPYSISTALSIAYVGAREETANEMEKILGKPNGNLLHILSDSYQTIKFANGMFVNTPLLPTFQESIKKEYLAHTEQVDFSQAESAVKKINAWVSEKTSEKINEVISQNDVNNATKLVITNAIYFKKEWKYCFDTNATQNAPFYKTKTEKTNVPMMSQEQTLFYMENDGIQMLELPYKNDNLSMLILLPKKIDGLAALKQSITHDTLNDLQTKLEPQKVFVKLPKFTLETAYNLNEPLQALGMKHAFSNSADFSGINGKKNLFISKVAHKAYIAVTEHGTQAAGATAAILNAKCAAPFKVPVTTFNADHPFMFIIRENNTGIILFMGSVCEL